MTFNSEQLQRRITQGLETTIERVVVPVSTEDILHNISAGTVITEKHYTLVQRLKGILIERVLPIVNLTSYNSVQRAREREQQSISRAASLEMRIAQFQHELELIDQKHTALKQAHHSQSALLALVEQVSRELRNPAVRDAAGQLLVRFFGEDNDKDLTALLETYSEADKSHVPYWDLRAAVRVLGSALKPQNYLEIGTRRGWSLTQLLAVSPHSRCFVFDAWADGYANPAAAPSAVKNKMKQVVGSDPAITFVSGNSHNTLPQFFRRILEAVPPQFFDLITVDGDHSLIGAWQDLFDVFPHVRVGGAIVFADLELEGQPAQFGSKFRREEPPASLVTLRDVWHQFAAKHPNFVFIDCFHLQFQAGVAIRIR